MVVIGGTAGIGLETARLARAEGADVILTARDPDRLARVAAELGARSSSAFDATDFERLAEFFDQLPAPIDHVLVTGPGPYYGPLAELDLARARRDIESHLLLPIQVARAAARKVRPGGSLVFMGGTGGRRTAPGFALISPLTAAGPALTKVLALEVAPVRVNLIAAGFVDTPLSAAILGSRAGRAARTAPQDAAHPPRRGAGRRRRAGRAPHAEHRADGRDLRHRRRPAARGGVSHVRRNRPGSASFPGHGGHVRRGRQARRAFVGREPGPIPTTPLDATKRIDAGSLSVGYAEAGPSGGPAVILLHGWPYDIQSFAEVVPTLISAGYRVIVPYLRGYGSTRFRSSEAFRNGQPSALAMDVIDLMDALEIKSATLAGFDWGARSADIVAALWPERCKALVSVSGYLIGSQQAGKMPLPPPAELQWWYQFYFATERGRAGYEKNRHDFAKLIWQLASPKWNFDDATFDRSAASFDNPDHVAIVIHNYRWRLGLAEGEPKYDELEKKLALAPVITVPTITLEGDANGAPHAEPAAYAAKFSGKYQHRTISGGVGHNLPQEAPQAFAKAVVDVDRM